MTNVPDDELPWTPDDESESGLLAPDEPEDEPPQRGLLRAQIRLGVAGLVTIVGLWLAQALLPDAAYYLQNDAKPQRIESWAALAESGESLADLRNRFVDLSATPDVRTAAKLSRKDEAGDSTFVRIVESEMSLFVTMPRPPMASGQTIQYPGRFVGRIRPLADLGVFKWVQAYFQGQDLRERHVLEKAQWQGLRGEIGQTLTLGGGKTWSLGVDEQFEVTVRLPERTVQLGRQTWKTTQAAQAALAGLSVPFAQVDASNGAYFTYVVRDGDRSIKELEAALNLAAQAPADSPHLEEGARVFETTRSFIASVDHVAGQADGNLRILPVSQVLHPGWDLTSDGKLSARTWPKAGFAYPAQDIIQVAVTKRLQVDRHAQVLVTGELPSSQWANAALFAVVLLMIAGNLVAAARAFAAIRKSTAVE